jgi:hypothetical protein
MNAHEAFLRLDPSDQAQNARIVTLADHGFAPSQSLRIEVLGDYDNGPGGDVFAGIMAVFSSSATLLGPTLVARVPDAIDAGMDYTTIPTCPNNLATDIPQDFTIVPGGVEVQIPAGATHLFLATRDCLYRDNTDPDGDFGVRLEDVTVAVPEAIAGELFLGQPHPNPARAGVTIPLSLPASGSVQIAVHAVDGRVVRVWSDPSLPRGPQQFTWDGRDERGSPVAAGVYFIRLATARRMLERQVVILR